MSTVVHSDGIKTAIHTSNFQTKARLNYLLRSGMIQEQVDSLEKQWQIDERKAHDAEHDRVVEMVRFLREGCGNAPRADMYLDNSK